MKGLLKELAKEYEFSGQDCEHMTSILIRLAWIPNRWSSRRNVEGSEVEGGFGDGLESDGHEERNGEVVDAHLDEFDAALAEPLHVFDGLLHEINSD